MRHSPRSRGHDRRSVLAGLAAGLGCAIGSGSPAWAAALAAVGGGLDAGALGLRPDAADAGRLLQDLLRQATARGQALVLPPGEFRASAVACPDGARLVGVPGQTRLIASAPGPILTARGIGRLAVSGLGLVGPGGRGGEAHGLLDAAGVGRLLLEDVSATGAAQSGIRLVACGGHVLRLRVDGAAETGLHSLDATGLTIRDADIRRCGNNGIQVWRSAKGEDGTLVEGCRIAGIRFDGGGDGPNGNGISVYRAGGVLVRGNVIADCALTAIRNNGGSGVAITGNSCRNCGEVAIFQEFAFDGGIVSDNRIEDALVGISITNLDQGGRIASCSGNVIRRLRRKAPPYAATPDGGIGINVEAECAVTGNVVDEADLAGIAVGWGPFGRNVTVTGNVVRASEMGVRLSVVEGVAGVVISGNVFAEVKRGGVIGHAWDKAVTGDLAGSEPAAPPRPVPGLVVSGNSVRLAR